MKKQCRCLSARSTLLVLFALVVCSSIVGCSTDNDLPHERTSRGLTMDGTHFVPWDGAPDQIDSVRLVDTAGFAGWSTAPVSLAGGGFVIGTRNGLVYWFGANDSLQKTIALPSHSYVDQLLTDGDSCYALTIDGWVGKFDRQGKLVWQTALHAAPTSNAVLVKHAIVIPQDSAVVALRAENGQQSWTYTSGLSCVGLAVPAAQDVVVAGLSRNVVGGSDSIIVLNLASGHVANAFGLDGARISSNVTLAGEDGNDLIVGTLRNGDAEGHASEALEFHDWRSKPVRQWRHAVPYVIVGVSANQDKAVVCGFRAGSGDLISGMEAFELADTSVAWKRRFTEPVTTAAAIGPGSIYFTLSFETQAIVGARGLLFTLESGTGKTSHELALPGSSGALSAMPMPDDRGRLLVADRERPTIYILDRSTLKRVF